MPTTVNLGKLAMYRQKFGDLTYMRAFGQGILLLNTTKAIHDLLDKRARIYSDKPRPTMAVDIIGLNQSMPLAGYDDRYKLMRKMTNSAFNRRSIEAYQECQYDAVRFYLKSLFRQPSEFQEQARRNIIRLVLRFSYGLGGEMVDAEYVSEAKAMMHSITTALLPGAYAVDFIPWLKYLPSWFPFAEFQRIGRKCHDEVLAFADRPFQYVKAQLTNGSAAGCMVADLLRDISSVAAKSKVNQEEAEDVLKWTAGSMLAAAQETTYATTMNFLIAMALYPDVQTKAQTEISEVASGTGLITIEDLDRLPYVQAVVKEVLRWRVSIPQGLPRQSMEDDWYNGHFIPSGTVIFPNLLAISRDVDRPEEFLPERFIGTDSALNPSDYAFGFGRRICPGKHLVESFIPLLVANILLYYNIREPSVIPEGSAGPRDVQYTKNTVSQPESFALDISPRSGEHVKRLATMDS
ncbi:cytochrome P450 [Panus rudis PR-1116 ss-1]|nr:cytochrome P450 [Panus rudis PR-1116 ss-1]